MRNFFQQTFASTIGTFFGLMLFFGLGTVGLMVLILAAASLDGGAGVKDKSVLVFDLSTNITDSRSSATLGEALVGSETNTVTLRTVLEALDKASKDRRIVALYLDGRTAQSESSTGLATLKEVRGALERFRASGKKVIAYDVDVEKREYYLSSVADTIVLNPMGTLELNGLASQPMFFAGAFEKYGVGVQVIRVGKFKSAVEPYIRKNLSPENRQQTQVLLNNIWSDFLTTISKSRKVTPQQLQVVADTQGFLPANEARQRRLVDKVGYFDEVVANLKQIGASDEDDETFRQISITSYANSVSQQADRSSDKKIAMVYAEGDIVDGEGTSRQVGGDRFAKQLRELRQDENVKAVVLRVNTPGGSASASDVILREVQLLQKQKPVIVSMGDTAASGGYWISSYADRIFAQPTTITGSIGVFGMLLNIQELANNNGITWDAVKTSRLADTQTITRPKTPQELAISQKSVNQIYDLFLTKVAQSRKLAPQKVAEIAQGRVWSGQQALQLGLVDQLGGIDDAVQYAVKQAKLGDDWQLEEYPKSRSLSEEIWETLAGGATAKQPTPDALTAEFLNLHAELNFLKAMNDPKGIYARLPFNIRIE